MPNRLLCLGAAPAQIPAIEYARNAGYDVITADYCPDNPGHRLAKEFYNVSTTNLEGILELARRIGIDGIVAYASDPAAPTAAYVAEKLGLPGSPFAAVNTLARKDLFRKFLQEHNFPAPRFFSCDNLAAAVKELPALAIPVVVKPVDSSGSKGVSVVAEPARFPVSFQFAQEKSRSGMVIVEEFIGKLGEQILGEAFVWDGQVVFLCLAEHHFNMEDSALVPVGGIFPHPSLSEKYTDGCRLELNRLLRLTGHRVGAMNLEFRIGGDGCVYIMEAGPRNGGNMIPQLIQHATGCNMVQYTVEAALGKNCGNLQYHAPRKYYAYAVIHSQREGALDNIRFSKKLQQHTLQSFIWAKKGDRVSPFTGANCSLGVILLQNDSPTDLIAMMNHVNEHISIDLFR